MAAETVTVRVHLGRWLRFRLWLLGCLVEIAMNLAPRRRLQDQIFDWYEERALEMVERGARAEVVST